MKMFAFSRKNKTGRSVNSLTDYSIHWYSLGKDYIIIKKKIKIKNSKTMVKDGGRPARKIGAKQPDKWERLNGRLGKRAFLDEEGEGHAVDKDMGLGEESIEKSLCCAGGGYE